jgi:Mg2+ and Co2+ transporter CorA
MNFRVMPETQWTHGYTLFWVLSAVITVCLTLALRRARIL